MRRHQGEDVDSGNFEVIPEEGDAPPIIVKRATDPRVINQVGTLSQVVARLIAVRREDRHTERLMSGFRASVVVGLTTAFGCVVASLVSGQPLFLIGFLLGVLLAAVCIRGFLREAQRDLDDRRLSMALGVLRNIEPDIDQNKAAHVVLDLREPYQLQRLPSRLDKTYTGRHRFPWLEIKVHLHVGMLLHVRVVAEGSIAEKLTLSQADRVRLDREESWKETVHVRLHKPTEGSWQNRSNPARFPKDLTLDQLETDGREARLQATTPPYVKVVKQTVLTDGSSRRLHWEKLLTVIAWMLSHLAWKPASNES